MLKITYLSDSNSDFRCLEDYLSRRKFGKLHDQDVYGAHHNVELMRRFYESVASRLGLANSKFVDSFPTTITLPTRYESPLNYQLLHKLVEQIKNGAKFYEINTANFPYYSSIPTGLVNAQAVNLPCSKHSFLLFDSQLFLYCHLFAKAFALCIPVVEEGSGYRFSVDSEEIAARVEKFPECIDRLIDLLAALDETEMPGHAKPYIPDMAHSNLGAVFREGMELFVVAHEFGHVYADHLSSILPRVSFPAQSLDDNNSSHIQEYEADAIGLLLAVTAQARNGFDLALSYVGTELFFHALEMQEKFSHLMTHGTDENYVGASSETHPSHFARRMTLRGGLRQFFENREDCDAALGLAHQYEEIVNTLWQAVQRRFLEPR